MSSYFAQSLWHIPLSPHQWGERGMCLTLLMLGTIYLGIFLETSQAFIQLPCFASSSGPGTLSQVLNFVLGMCKNADSLNYRYMYQERRGEKGTRHHRLLQHSYFFWYRDQDQDFFSLVIWNYKFVWVHPPSPFFYFFPTLPTLQSHSFCFLNHYSRFKNLPHALFLAKEESFSFFQWDASFGSLLPFFFFLYHYSNLLGTSESVLFFLRRNTLVSSQSLFCLFEWRIPAATPKAIRGKGKGAQQKKEPKPW